MLHNFSIRLYKQTGKTNQEGDKSIKYKLNQQVFTNAW